MSHAEARTSSYGSSQRQLSESHPLSGSATTIRERAPRADAPGASAAPRKVMTKSTGFVGPNEPTTLPTRNSAHSQRALRPPISGGFNLFATVESGDNGTTQMPPPDRCEARFSAPTRQQEEEEEIDSGAQRAELMKGPTAIVEASPIHRKRTYHEALSNGGNSPQQNHATQRSRMDSTSWDASARQHEYTSISEGITDSKRLQPSTHRQTPATYFYSPAQELLTNARQRTSSTILPVSASGTHPSVAASQGDYMYSYPQPIMIDGQLYDTASVIYPKPFYSTQPGVYYHPSSPDIAKRYQHVPLQMHNIATPIPQRLSDRDQAIERENHSTQWDQANYRQPASAGFSVQQQSRAPIAAADSVSDDEIERLYTASGQRRQRRPNTSSEETSYLEHVFSTNQHPDRNLREEIAIKLHWTTRSVQIWFQNRRSKLKKGE